MNDPHLAELVYSFRTDPDRFDFSEAAPREFQLANFSCRLADGKLVATPEGHYTTDEDARAILDPRLRAWEAATDIGTGVQIEFRFANSRIIDRAPTPGDPETVVQAFAGTVTAIGGEARVMQKHREHPTPPSEHFTETAFVAQLRRELNEHRQGARLLAQSQLILTRLQAKYGGRDGAAAALNVSKKVLNKLGELSERGHPVEERKVKPGQQPLTPAEEAWVRDALPALVMQMAETEGRNPALPKLTMADLPNL